MLQINSRSPTFRKQVIAILVSGVFAHLAFANKPEYEAPPLDEIVVSASGYEQKIMDTAASINLVTINQIQNGQARDNLSEPLNRVPGIFALNRQNYAQDLQISSRGFGANSTFGTRGIRLIVDNIPGTVADGQGQISHIDLPSTDRIEVMRGPFSVLYGNSSGGVIRVFTQDGGPKTEVQPYFEVGSYGQRRAGLKASGKSDVLGYVIDAGQFHTNGYRDQSAADRRNANAKLSFMGGPDTRITLIANNVSLRAEDPLGLNINQLISNPKQAGTNAISKNTRKSVDQTQTGASIDFRINANNNLLFTPYLGQRRTIQFASANVIDLERSFYGVDGKWTHQNKLFDIPISLVSGISMNENDDHRRTYTNTGGIAVFDSTSSQNYAMSAKNFDQYLQADLRITERLVFNTGIRNSQTTLSSNTNNTLTTSVGSNAYRAMTHMASLQYYLTEITNVHLSYGSSFDTPTLNQVLYNSDGTGSSCTTVCSNFGLLAAKTKQVELGLKSKVSPGIQTNVALFNADTSDDIVIGTSNSGKTAFTNAPRTNRQGIEGGAQFKLPYHLEANIAYTWLNATVKESYTYYNGTTAYTVLSGNRIPGVPNQGLFAELLWVKPNKSMETAIEGRVNGSMAVNDRNSDYMAPGYAVMNIRGVLRQEFAGGWSFSQFFRINNVLDRSYVGSVIVNQSSSQYYEPAPTRNWMIGAKASYQFK
jgi:iron complex outermembrane receptor protein